MTSPDFIHAPLRPSWSMLAYGGRDRDGSEREPLEFNYTTPIKPKAVIARAKFEARWQFRTHVKVRMPDGRIIYDGGIE